MSWVLIAAVVLVAITFIFLRLFKKKAPSDAGYPYKSAGPLFTPAERSFYGVLCQAVGLNATVFGKVRVADVAIPKKGLSRGEWQKSFNKVSGKHFDFTICSNDDLSVVCVIELDDDSHKSEKRKKRDTFLKGVCSAADIPFIQVPANRSYVIADIQGLLAPYLDFAETKYRQENVAGGGNDKSEKICPQCSSPMVVRVAKKGRNAGKKFWACSAYPKCRHIEAIAS